MKNNANNYVMEITRKDGAVLKMESSSKEFLLQRARLYHNRHPEAKIMVYEVSCIFTRETMNQH